MTSSDGATSQVGGRSESGLEQQLNQGIETKNCDVFRRAVSNVLSSPIAEITYAQTIDGLPLSDVTLDTHDATPCPGHPLLDERIELSPGVLEKARQLYSSFDATVLKFDSGVSRHYDGPIWGPVLTIQLLHAYQIAAPGSRAFQTTLIELVARAIHNIAVWLFKQEPTLPPTNELVAWRPSEEDEDFYPNGYPPTLFWHPWYHDYDQYPEGVADIVGYWAESRVFGGVVLFDRRCTSPGSDAASHDVYLHADRRDVTYRIFKLLDEQKHDLVRFLLSDATPETCPLPILGDLSNRERVDPEEPVELTGIYRDKWERKPLSKDDDDARLRDVIDLFNYLSQDEWAAAKDRAMRKRVEFRRQ
ncbi:hypothetical protein FALBO_6032 [Fusarium albosuccineum]|uniref:Uncharacterized protein n=1 Tax=Fusarium albosuccineum TaxID=1237068 RepID=A0A8H4LDQ5_9HYPO|nr:hypothetical protein FALBO_6032 [Fusarium albosuccineum]